MQQFIHQLESLISGYSDKIANIPESEFSSKPVPGKWSKKEILGHLIDSAQNNIQRFVRGQYEKQPHIIYSQDEWVAIQDYQHYPTEQLIQLWLLLNKHICVILSCMPKEAYTLQCDTGKEEERLYTLEYLAEDYATHLLHHLEQIIPNK